MSIKILKKTAEEVLDRMEVVRGKGEEATKQAMILPMIKALGYDIWNPDEVCPEFDADVPSRKGGKKERVDYAIILKGEPRIYIEAKSVDEDLTEHHHQLERYFNTNSSVSLGILTNGIEYRFFTDTGEPNIQDEKPFFISKLDAIEPGFNVLAKFQKDVFSANAIRDYATELTYTARIMELLKAEIDLKGDGEISESLLRWILKSDNIYEGVVNSNVVKRFTPIATDALNRVIRSIVFKSLAKLDDKVESKEESKGEASKELLDEIITESKCDDTEEPDLNDKIVTTEEELESFAIIKKIFEESDYVDRVIYDPSSKQDLSIEINYKDTMTYFGIYFNKSSWWNVRLSLDGKTKWIGIDVDPELGKTLVPNDFEIITPSSLAKFRVKLENYVDIERLKDVILASFEKTIQDRELKRIS